MIIRNLSHRLSQSVRYFNIQASVRLVDRFRCVKTQLIKPVSLKTYNVSLQVHRGAKSGVRSVDKYVKGGAKDEDSDSDTDEKKPQLEDEEDNEDGNENIPGTKIMNFKTTQARVDRVLKVCYGNKNEIEAAFLQGNIRKNGLKVLKKAQQVVEGDVLDLVKGEDPSNSTLLTVFRLEVLELQDHSNSTHGRVRITPDLLVKPYDD